MPTGAGSTVRARPFSRSSRRQRGRRRHGGEPSCSAWWVLWSSRPTWSRTIIPGSAPRSFAGSSRVRDAVAQMARIGKARRYLRSALVPADESFFCVIEAASEELAREAYARAGIPFERISPALLEEG